MQLGAVAEDDLVIAAEQRAQLADAIDIDDDGPADARKDPWVEPGLEAALAADRGADSATPSFVVLQAGELNAPPASRSIGTPNGRAAPADSQHTRRSGNWDAAASLESWSAAAIAPAR